MGNGKGRRAWLIVGSDLKGAKSGNVLKKTEAGSNRESFLPRTARGEEGVKIADQHDPLALTRKKRNFSEDRSTWDFSEGDRTLGQVKKNQADTKQSSRQHEPQDNRSSPRALKEKEKRGGNARSQGTTKLYY